MKKRNLSLIIISLIINIIVFIIIGYIIFSENPFQQIEKFSNYFHKKDQKELFLKQLPSSQSIKNSDYIKSNHWVDQEKFSVFSDKILTLNQKNLKENKKVNSKEYNQAIDKIKFLLAKDDSLELIDIDSMLFHQSEFKKDLRKISWINLYILIEFKKPLTKISYLDQINSKGFARPNKPKTVYLNKKIGIFYGKYSNLKQLRHLPFIHKIYILKQFTAKGDYTLDIQTDKNIEALNMKFYLPYSQNGRDLLNQVVSFNYWDAISSYKEDVTSVHATLNMKLNKSILLSSSIEYLINVEKLLKNHIYVRGDIKLSEYLNKMSNNSKEKQKFTEFTDKIILSDYIKEIAQTISLNDTLAEVWGKIKIRLDKDIKYDYSKRKAFFSGRQKYSDIKDMYLSTLQLGERRIGACPERSSLEAAIFRYVGIPARTATRLYHIYAEILMPDYTWLTTSDTLRAIPLCYSKDAKQSYFVSWTPNHPIYLKWQGDFYPVVLY